MVNTNETPAATPLPEAATPASSPEMVTARAEAAEAFQRCLEKVVTIHDRLLAELAK